jgi:hypothetical protein
MNSATNIDAGVTSIPIPYISVFEFYLFPGPFHIKKFVREPAIKLFYTILKTKIIVNKETTRTESASEIYRPNDLSLSAKLAPGVSRGQRTDPFGSILCFLYRSRYFLFQVGPELYKRIILK